MELLDGPGTLEAWLLPRLKTADVIGILTGWLSAPGVAKVHPHLVRVLGAAARSRSSRAW